MVTLRSDRKRQTRLSFTPLPSSSPARSECPAAVQDRAASVTIDSSPSKRRRLGQTQLPTPLPSSQREDGDNPPQTPSQTRTTSPFMNTAVQGRNPYSRDRQKRFRKSKLTRRKVASSESESDSTGVDSQYLSEDTQHPGVTGKGSGVSEAGPDSDEDDVLPPTRRLRTVKVLDSGLNDVDSESGITDDEPLRDVSSTKKRQEQEDLDSDLEFLGSASADDSRALRKNSTPQKTAKQKALEKYKSKRRQQHQAHGPGLSVDVDASEEDQETQSEVDEGSENGDSEGDHTSIGFYPDEDDAAFIVEDGDDPTSVQLPMQFSRHRTMARKDLFKIVIEWIVQNKMNPAFNKEDEIYTNAFARLDDFLQGMGGSKYQSSAWNPTFVRTLRARPEIECNEIAITGLHGDCGACNRSNHQASFEVVFGGALYDKRSLESQSDSESDVGEGSSNTQTRFHLGRHCARNAKTAHALEHWRYHLSEWVKAHLEYEGYLEPERIVERDSWSTRRRHKFASKIVTEMHDSGVIKGLYMDFKNETQTAQMVDNDYRSGHGRNVFLRD